MRAQAIVRIVICAFIGLYYLSFGIKNHPTYLAFAVYSLFLLFATQNGKIKVPIHPLVTLIIDNGFAICGLHQTGEKGAFLLFFIIHISFAYGVRFGRDYLIFSLCVAFFGVTWLYIASDPWQGRIHFLLSFLFGMPFISIYVLYLTNQLRQSEARANETTKRTNELLTFLAHDIRGPLHHIHESAGRLQLEPLSLKGAESVSSIHRLVEFMARMVSRVLSDNQLKPSTEDISSTPETSPAHEAAVYWLVRFAEMYRHLIEKRGAQLKYQIAATCDAQLPRDVTPFERILSNILSNSIRYCIGGEVLISMTYGNESPSKLKIAIENEADTGARFVGQSESHLNSNELLAAGSGLGLKVAHENAQSIGGHFTFSQLTESRYSSVFEFYAIRASEQFSFSTTTPVIVLSCNPGLFQDCVKKCTGIANIYWSKGEFNPSKKSDTSSGQLSSIYVYDESEFDEMDATVNNIPASAVQIALRQKGPEDVIVVERRRVSVTGTVSPCVMKNALQIAEAILTSLALDERAPSVSLARQYHALVMDDSPLNLAILKEKLAQLGIGTVAVTSTTDAASVLGARAFDLFILDWNVGLHTAQPLLHSLMNHPTHKNMKCIIISAEDIRADRFQTSAPNRIRRLVKPVSDALFQSAIFDLIDDSGISPAVTNNSSPEAIFNCATYLSLGLNARTIQFTKELLTNFIESLDQAFKSIESQVASMAISEIGADAHKLASMCYSAGAYALGDEFKSINDALLSDRQVGPDVVRRRIHSMTRIYKLTECHISHFVCTLDCLDSTSKCNTDNFLN